jgi:hypothetical protein
MLKQYETTMIWSGQACYDTTTLKGRRFFADGKHMLMEDVAYPQTLNNVEHTEKVLYTLYSVVPLVWSEDSHLFVETIS